MLLADDDKQPRVSLTEAEKDLLVSKCRADEQDVIKPATERATELVHEELCLTRVSCPHDEHTEGNLASIQYFSTA